MQSASPCLAEFLHPLVDSPKCPRCSLVGICLPDETLALFNAVAGEEADAVEQLRLSEDGGSDAAFERQRSDVRRLIPAGDDQRPLYVTGYGFSIGKSGACCRSRRRESLSRRRG
jgi:CRISP-associated protein Cas1